MRKVIRMVVKALGLYQFSVWFRENLHPMRALLCKFNYKRQLERIRNKPKSEKIRVLFIVSEIAKWKEQKVYEQMESSGIFEPIVGLSAWNKQSGLSSSELEAVHTRAEAFFDRLGDRHVRTVRIESGEKVFADLREFNADIVYYTEPWSPCKGQTPWEVSKFALTFYTPYYVPNYGYLYQECHLPVQRCCYGYFCLGEAWKVIFEKSLRFVVHICQFVPTGHPALDYFSCVSSGQREGDKIIYAPHFSFYNVNSPDYIQLYSTFDWNYKEILQYAKQHREFTWVFKPHPILRMWAQASGLMTKQEVEKYYNEWAKIGIVCEDGDYQKLFREARVMITDCGSFLTEFGATGKPVIHLKSSRNPRTPIQRMKGLYDTYYQVNNLDEMYGAFKMVIEECRDPNRDQRLVAVKNVGLCGVNASANIVNYLKLIFSR